MRTEAISVFMPAFGLHLPNQSFPLQEQNVHPLSVTTPQGLDLDFSALMAFDKLIIDSGARARIMDRSRGYLRPMRETLIALESEDLTITLDFSKDAKALHPVVEKKTNTLIEDVDHWRPRATEHWRIYRPMLLKLLDQYRGHCDLEQEKLHFGVYCYLRQQSDKVDVAEGQRLNRFLESQAKLRNRPDRELFKELIRPLVHQTVLNNLLRERLKSPFIDWDDLNVYYNGIDEFQISDDSKKERSQGIILRSKEVFSAALPDLRPKTVAAFIKFRKTSHAFRSFQDEILKAVQLGTTFDQKWARKLHADATRALLTQSGRTKRIKWILTPLKLAAPRIVSGGEFVADLIRGAGAMAEGGLEHAYSTNVLKFQWYYTLLEINSVTS